MKLSPHFTLEELTATAHRYVANMPTKKARAAFSVLATNMEKVRGILGDHAIHINSGYRSRKLNKVVGGVAQSAHMTGYAVDFICPGFGSPLAICKAVVKSGIAFDQIIQEGTWVHLSFAPANRRMVLTKSGHGYKPGL